MRESLPFFVLLIFLVGGAAPLPAADVAERQEASEAAVNGSRPPDLKSGAKTMDALLDQFLAALEKKDFDALHQLRVSREEYVDIIVPGTVEKGRPPRRIRDSTSQYFWEMLDFKSREYAKLMMERWGGRKYVERDVRFSEQPRQYAWYDAFGELRLRAKAQDDVLYEVNSGWIAEVNGKWKFIGFEWDD